MSASSNWVTCGTLSQERCRFRAATRRSFESGRTSTGPHFAKSTRGAGGRPKPAGSAGCGAPRASASRTKDCTSSFRILALRPVPRTSARSTPSSRASRRTEGLAWARRVLPKAGATGAAGRAGAGAGRCSGAGVAGARAAGDAGAGSASRRGSRAGATGAEAAAAELRGGSAELRSSSAPSRAASSTSSVAISEPWLTLSPTATCSARTTPAAGDGISIVAFSLSSVIRLCSARTRSPGATSTSITSTSSKSPMSGTRTCRSAGMAGSDAHRVRLLRVDAVARHRLRDAPRRDLPLVGERLERGHGDEAPVDLEERAQLLARVAAPETVGPERRVAVRHEGPDLLGVQLHVVGGRDDRARAGAEAALDVREARRLLRVQQVPALHLEAVATQLGEARRAPDVGCDLPVLAQELGGGDHLAQDRAGAEQLHPQAPRGRLPQQVEAAHDALAHPLRHRRLHVILV